MPLIKYTRNNNGTYGPTVNNHYYISKLDHRRTAKRKKGKNRWDITEGEEFSVFKPSVENFDDWYCKENRCIFSLIDKGDVILGRSGERLAKFPNNRNDGEPWHGYPVFTEDPQNCPSVELLERWKTEKKVPLHIIVRIERGSL
ncbi:hypothetical protein [uncultured Mucilaginibacter sp.]|uniref:hypothetical protein n=1 Tax=uncultured Mucilaginibacter sp. TaxID=797541 RepID=UPI002637331A|nr:hypothetical protein [uncultured Mucilaginibacter sp.]